MCLSEILTGIIGGALSITGLLLALSTIRLPRRRIKLRIGLGVPFFVLGFFILVTEFPQYALGFSILATLAMAWAAFLSVEESRRLREENRTIRGEEIERDFKRRCLNDIQDWADKGINLLVSCLVPVDQSEMRQIRPPFKSLRALNKWVMDASRIFAGDDKKALLKKVDEAAENLKQYCEVLEGKLSSEGMDQRHDQCLKSFTEVLERVADVKVKLRL